MRYTKTSTYVIRHLFLILVQKFKKKKKKKDNRKKKKKRKKTIRKRINRVIKTVTLDC